jgi:hypothetical protein
MKKLHAVVPNQRRNPAQVTIDFQVALVKLVDGALGEHAKPYLLIDVLEAQLVRLRLHDAARPW